MSHVYHTTLDDGATEVEVTYNYHPAEPTTWHEPGCCEQATIMWAHRIDNGERVKLTDAEDRRISQECLEWHLDETDHPDPDTMPGGHDWLRDHRVDA